MDDFSSNDFGSSNAGGSKEKVRRAVYCITDKPGLKKALWTKVGIAWLNQDQSWNVYLDCIPLSGKLNIREETERPARYGTKDGVGPSPQPFDPLGGIQ